MLKTAIKSSIASISCIAILILHSSFFSSGKTFASPAASFAAYSPAGTSITFSPAAAVTSEFLSLTNPFFPENPLHSFFISKSEVYDSLQLNMAGLSREAFEWGLIGMEQLLYSGCTSNGNILSIVDFSQPSSQKRLYVIDLENYGLLFNTWVAHGKNSGREMAESFSNNPSSNKSSLGFYLTGNTYRGKHGYSLKLTGLEKGINDNALDRAIVLHGADYVNESLASHGSIGRSQGCPAVSKKLFRPIIDNIKDGTCLFVYYPSADYVQGSGLLGGSELVRSSGLLRNSALSNRSGMLNVSQMLSIPKMTRNVELVRDIDL